MRTFIHKTILKTFHKFAKFEWCVGFFFFNNLIATNVLQLGAVCVGLCEGNCAKVLL